MVFNITFNNISAISWKSVLLVEETEVPGENPRHEWDSNIKIWKDICWTIPDALLTRGLCCQIILRLAWMLTVVDKFCVTGPLKYHLSLQILAEKSIIGKHQNYWHRCWKTTPMSCAFHNFHLSPLLLLKYIYLLILFQNEIIIDLLIARLIEKKNLFKKKLNTNEYRYIIRRYLLSRSLIS